MLKRAYLYFHKIYYWLIAYGLFFYCRISYADGGLPPAPQNSNFQSGEYVKGIKDFAFEVINVVILILAAAAIIGYGYAVIHQFLAAKKHKEWGEFGLVAVVGAGVVVVVIILANVGMQYFGGSSNQ